MSFPIQHAYLIGIGGIHVSAVAKLLIHKGVQVTGYEDDAASLIVDELRAQGIEIRGKTDQGSFPDGCDLVIYSSAVPESHPERVKAAAQSIRQLNSHAFVGEWFHDARQVVVTGTHGKSTTTGMLGFIASECGLDPTVIMGTRLATFPDQNLRMGKDALLIVEGDEYAYHVLEFSPAVLVLNNIEMDHVDLFPTIEAMRALYARLIGRMQIGGMLIVNADDAQTKILLEECQEIIKDKTLTVTSVGAAVEAYRMRTAGVVYEGHQRVLVTDRSGESFTLTLTVPGEINAQNALMALTALEAMGGARSQGVEHLSAFQGVWRRFERLSEQEGILIISDYGHHPTAVRTTLEAAKSFYPERRLVLCFQPHHRNRTKELFLDFIPSFDLADHLILVEIYDVMGREHSADEAISSQDLVDAIKHHDADRGVMRVVEFAVTPHDAKEKLVQTMVAGDLVLVMGAGSIYKVANEIAKIPT
ncbi:UDP-N-acetylmuramate--L-alanine ligase [Patescibacteria group bacterium]|nr:UDP-N-acetylmuramate--L-alanine ligase [Patescibacteria group bacterium]